MALLCKFMCMDDKCNPMFRIATMRTGDFSFAVKLANTMNWNMADEDFGFILQLEPNGCFVLFDESTPVGISTCISYGKIGWFGNLVVQEDYRKKGAGTILLKHSIEYLRNGKVETIGLYAYPHLIGFYEHFGFKVDMDFLAFKGKPVFFTVNEVVREAHSEEIPEILAFDNQCFGADRSKLLKPILSRMDNLCFVSVREAEIVGYVAAKVYQGIAEIGPLVCKENHADVAITLLKTVLCRLSGLDLDVFTCVSGKQNAVVDALLKSGFKKDFRVTRMFLGPAVAESCIYLAESLERG
jgi:GNAT superfamily N-acetyltransferase